MSSRRVFASRSELKALLRPVLLLLDSQFSKKVLRHNEPFKASVLKKEAAISSINSCKYIFPEVVALSEDDTTLVEIVTIVKCDLTAPSVTCSM